MSAAASPVLRRWSRVVASVFGLGHVPAAPGTVASAASVLAAIPLLRTGSAALPEAILLVTILGLLAVEQSGEAAEDPGWVVIDEVAGQWVALLALPHPSLLGLGLGFALFRAFDILKPGPIGWIDRRRNAAGVMGDDLLAGAAAALVLLGVDALHPHLLG